MLERYGARRREDLLLIVNAWLEAGAAVDPALIAQAARVARYGHDFGLVERLTTGVQPELSTAETVLLRAEALHELSDYAEVEQLLAACPIVPAMAEPLAVRLTAIRVRNLMWGLHRADEALQVNRAARDVLTSTDSIDELVTDEALTLVHSNRPGQALQALEQMSAEPAPRRSRPARHRDGPGPDGGRTVRDGGHADRTGPCRAPRPRRSDRDRPSRRAPRAPDGCPPGRRRAGQGTTRWP